MSGTVNQARAGVQKLVWLPLQRHASMRAAVVIDEHLAVAPCGEQLATIDFKPATLGFRQLITGAEQFQQGLRGACDVDSQAANCGSSFRGLGISLDAADALGAVLGLGGSHGVQHLNSDSDTDFYFGNFL